MIINSSQKWINIGKRSKREIEGKEKERVKLGAGLFSNNSKPSIIIPPLYAYSSLSSQSDQFEIAIIFGLVQTAPTGLIM